MSCICKRVYKQEEAAPRTFLSRGEDQRPRSVYGCPGPWDCPQSGSCQLLKFLTWNRLSERKMPMKILNCPPSPPAQPSAQDPGLGAAQPRRPGTQGPHGARLASPSHTVSNIESDWGTAPQSSVALHRCIRVRKTVHPETYIGGFQT